MRCPDGGRKFLKLTRNSYSRAVQPVDSGYWIYGTEVKGLRREGKNREVAKVVLRHRRDRVHLCNLLTLGQNQSAGLSIVARLPIAESRHYWKKTRDGRRTIRVRFPADTAAGILTLEGNRELGSSPSNRKCEATRRNNIRPHGIRLRLLRLEGSVGGVSRSDGGIRLAIRLYLLRFRETASSGIRLES